MIKWRVCAAAAAARLSACWSHLTRMPVNIIATDESKPAAAQSADELRLTVTTCHLTNRHLRFRHRFCFGWGTTPSFSPFLAFLSPSRFLFFPYISNTLPHPWATYPLNPRKIFGEHCKLPQRARRSSTDAKHFLKNFLVHFEVKKLHLSWQLHWIIFVMYYVGLHAEMCNKRKRVVSHKIMDQMLMLFRRGAGPLGSRYSDWFMHSSTWISFHYFQTVVIRCLCDHRTH